MSSTRTSWKLGDVKRSLLVSGDGEVEKVFAF